MSYYIIHEVKDDKESVEKEKCEPKREAKVEPKDEWEPLRAIPHSRINAGCCYLTIRKTNKENNPHRKMFRYTLTVGNEICQLTNMSENERGIILFDNRNMFRVKLKRCDGISNTSMAFIKNSCSKNKRIQFRRDWSYNNMQLDSCEIEVEDMQDGFIIVNFERAVKTYGY